MSIPTAIQVPVQSCKGGFWIETRELRLVQSPPTPFSHRDRVHPRMQECRSIPSHSLASGHALSSGTARSLLLHMCTSLLYVHTKHSELGPFPGMARSDRNAHSDLELVESLHFVHYFRQSLPSCLQP